MPTLGVGQAQAMELGAKAFRTSQSPRLLTVWPTLWLKQALQLIPLWYQTFPLSFQTPEFQTVFGIVIAAFFGVTFSTERPSPSFWTQQLEAPLPS